MTAIDWLLDSESDPAIRWQTLRDLTDASPQQIAAERARVAHEGWGARLLDAADDDGQWEAGAVFPGNLTAEPEHQPWTSTYPVLKQLWNFGVDPADPRVGPAIDLVRQNCKWEYDGADFFDGEVEPCINGITVGIGAYFGQDVRGIVDRLLTEPLDDGGWNCEVENGSTRSSFDTTINVLEGLLQYEQSTGFTDEVTAARERAHEYLLERHLMHRLSDGVVPDPHWLEFSYPAYWHYDVLRALDYFRSASVAPDDRMTAALHLVESKRQADGRWPLEHTHLGAVHFAMEAGDGQPSRWNTLRALRVLDRYRP